MDPAVAPVSCTSCERVWHSATMVEGLRLIGFCPRCGGELAFHEAPPAAAPGTPAPSGDDVAPHRVLGIPRR